MWRGIPVLSFLEMLWKQHESSASFSFNIFFAILHSIVSCYSFFRIDVFVCRLQNKSFEANTNPQHTYIHVPTQFYLLCFGQTSECGPIGWHYKIKLHRSRYYMCEPHNRRWRTTKKVTRTQLIQVVYNAGLMVLSSRVCVCAIWYSLITLRKEGKRKNRKTKSHKLLRFRRIFGVT